MKTEDLTGSRIVISAKITKVGSLGSMLHVFSKGQSQSAQILIKQPTTWSNLRGMFSRN